MSRPPSTSGASTPRQTDTLQGVKTEAPFQLDFVLDQKAAVSVDSDSGDLYIEGYASDFGTDRQDEAFEPGAFEKGMEAFMRNPVLCFHHQFDKALGQVEQFEHRKDGLWVKARLDKPTAGSWAEDVFEKVKRGTIKAFSVGGRFKRRAPDADGRQLIHEADIAEISVTPLPVNPRTLFAVAGKAFGEDPDLTAVLERLDAAGKALDGLGEALDERAATS